MTRLSIILPYYNPLPEWSRQVALTYEQLRAQLGFPPELILINDGSTRLAESELEYLKSTIPALQLTGYADNQGKGAALRYGIGAASGERLIYTDIDFPYTVESFLSIWEALQSHDIAIGIKDTSYYQHLPKARVRISKLLRKMIGFFFRMPVTDTQCGLKGFNQKGKAIFLRTSIKRYLCDLEFVYLSYRAKPRLNITARPVKLREGVAFGKMKTRVLLAEFFNFLKILFRKSV